MKRKLLAVLMVLVIFLTFSNITVLAKNDKKTEEEPPIITREVTEQIREDLVKLDNPILGRDFIRSKLEPYLKQTYVLPNTEEVSELVPIILSSNGDTRVNPSISLSLSPMYVLDTESGKLLSIAWHTLLFIFGFSQHTTAVTNVISYAESLYNDLYPLDDELAEAENMYAHRTSEKTGQVYCYDYYLGQSWGWYDYSSFFKRETFEHFRGFFTTQNYTYKQYQVDLTSSPYVTETATSYNNSATITYEAWRSWYFSYPYYVEYWYD